MMFLLKFWSKKKKNYYLWKKSLAGGPTRI